MVTPLPRATQHLAPIHLTLKDGTPATALPISSSLANSQTIPSGLFTHLHTLFNHEIIHGATYPSTTPYPTTEAFISYWFSHFACVLVPGTYQLDNLPAEIDADFIIGSFYVRPNYPGHSAHICNGGFFVNPTHRGKAVGRKLGEIFIQWAPKLGYTNSVFNLVYESNPASWKIWDSLGFERIGRIPRSRWDEKLGWVDAIVYGYDFLKETESAV